MLRPLALALALLISSALSARAEDISAEVYGVGSFEPQTAR
jgi:hypothetical protein